MGPEAHILSHLLELKPAEIVAEMNSRMVDSFNQLVGKNLHPLIQSLEDERQGQTTDFLIHSVSEVAKHMEHHPAWKHPGFVEWITENEDEEETLIFNHQIYHYLLSIGPLAGLSLGRLQGSLPPSGLSHRATIYEVGRHLLSRLLLFCYQSTGEPVGETPEDEQLLTPSKKIESFEGFINSLGTLKKTENRAMIHGMADYINILRLFGASYAFTELESFSAITIDTIWSGPIFLSLILSGNIHFADQKKISLQDQDIRPLTDTIHFLVRIAPHFMLINLLLAGSPDQIQNIKNTINTVFAGRYGFLTDLERQSRGKRSRSIEEIDKSETYHSRDHRIETELSIARQTASEKLVQFVEKYRSRNSNPFAFLD